jgi:predicted RNA-binding protein
MGKPTYWLDLFTGTTWQEFLDAGAKVSGFRDKRWKAVQAIKPGDFLLCYLTGISRFIGLLEVVSEPFRDDSRIWKDEDFPCRVHVRPTITLTPETAVPVQELKDHLSIFTELKSPHAWTGHFRGSPIRWKTPDALEVVKALEAAQANPVVREVDPAKLARRPRALSAKIGPVSVPGAEEPAVPEPEAEPEAPPHTELQALLLRLGADMGLDVWVARNDRGKEWGGYRLGQFPRVKAELPLQFDEATTKTIELIDVLWLRGNAIVAAFEIESTTSIYSGLLRMADLIAMQPNINIPLLLVAPADRRNKVIAEVNRPTFHRLSPPLVEMCRYMSFESLRKKIKEVEAVVRYLKPEFLDEVAEAWTTAGLRPSSPRPFPPKGSRSTGSRRTVPGRAPSTSTTPRSRSARSTAPREWTSRSCISSTRRGHL